MDGQMKNSTYFSRDPKMTNAVEVGGGVEGVKAVMQKASPSIAPHPAGPHC